MSRPQPVPKSLVCSECGLAWSLHPDNPRRRDCIKLLKTDTLIVSVPWYSTTHYCHMGHANCWTDHSLWTTTHFDTTGNYSGFVTGNANKITGTPDDDPDMGVPAIVS